jgi:DnaJ-class molecular chaperone
MSLLDLFKRSPKKEKRHCPSCGGIGYITRQNSARLWQELCKACKGNGWLVS